MYKIAGNERLISSFHLFVLSLCVLHLASLDIEADFKKDLQQLMFDLRLECFKVIMDHACLGNIPMLKSHRSILLQKFLD